jgi:hypothetical protein
MIAEDLTVRDEILRNLPHRGAPRPAPTRLSGVGYGRISKHSRTKLETQKQRVQEYFSHFLPHVPMDAWYEDDDRSRVRSHNRPQYQRMLAELAEG